MHPNPIFGLVDFYLLSIFNYIYVGFYNVITTLHDCNCISDVPKKPQRPIPKKKPKLVMQDGKMTAVTAE